MFKAPFAKPVAPRCGPFAARADSEAPLAAADPDINSLFAVFIDQKNLVVYKQWIFFDRVQDNF